MIPKDVNDLSIEFFSSILECPVAHFTVESVDFQGNCSVVHRIRIDFEGSLTFPPKWLYLKFALPASDTNIRNVSVTRKLLIETGAYRKELAFYKWARNARALERVIPPVFYAEIEEPGHLDHFLLVLGETGECLNQINGCSLQISKQIIRQAAHFHAPFISNFSQNIQNDPLLHICYKDPIHHLIAYVVAPNLKNSSPQELLQFAQSALPEKFSHFCLVATAMGIDSNTLQKVQDRITSGDFAADLAEAFQWSFIKTGRLQTLVHGDFRLDNMLLSKQDNNNNDIRFIDFQALHYGHPAYDLAQFIVQCHENSHLLIREFVSLYYNTLCELDSRVSQVSTFQDMLDSIQSAVIFQVLMLTFHLANLKGAICVETGKLPKSMGDRFMDLIPIITRRGLETYLALKST